MLELIFQYEHRDATEALNARLSRLMQRGIYYGGRLTPIAGTLQCVRSPIGAVGQDGCTVRDTQYQTLTYTPGTDNYHCILAKYNALGDPSTPTLSEVVMSASAYTAHAEKDYLIVLGRVQLAGGATEVLAANIHYDVRDECGPLGRLIWKGTVATTGDLPTDSTVREGDIYHVQSNDGLYVWDGSAWTLVTAKGAATLDGAYDDGGSGAGRVITADSGAVEVVQDVTADRVEDIFNSAVRVRQEGSSAPGSLGLDIVKNGLNHLGGLLVRERLVFGTDIQADEPIDVAAGAGGPITFTRVGCSLITYNYGAVTGAMLVLVEISGSPSGSNNGVFLLDVTGATTAGVKGPMGVIPAMVAEPGLTANIYIVRSIIGSNVNALFGINLGLNSGDFEFLGSAAPPSIYAGKTIAWLQGGTSKVLRGLYLDPGHTTEVFYLLEKGNIVLRPEWYNGAACIDISGRETTNLVSVTNAGNNSGSIGIFGRSMNAGAAGLHGDGLNAVGVRGTSNNSVGVEGSSFGHTAVKTVTWALPLTFSPHPTYWQTQWPGTPAANFFYQTIVAGVGTEITLVLQTSYFPEGCVIIGVNVDWEAAAGEATGANRMLMYADHIRKTIWDANPPVVTTLNAALGYLEFGSASAERRLDTMSTDRMGWTHGKATVGSYVDMLRIGFRPRTSGIGDKVYGVYIEAEILTVNQFTGPAVTP
jgi:hypothetical protein